MAVLGLSWPSFGALLGRLGLVWGTFWAVVTAGGGGTATTGLSPARWPPLGSLLGPLLGPSWGPLGPLVGPSWGFSWLPGGPWTLPGEGFERECLTAPVPKLFRDPSGSNLGVTVGAINGQKSYENYMFLYIFVN